MSLKWRTDEVGRSLSNSGTLAKLNLICVKLFDQPDAAEMAIRCIYVVLRFLLLLGALGVLASAEAQHPPVPAFSFPTPPTIDGTVGDDEWKGAPRFDGLVDASTGGPAPESAQFWLAYDKDFVYFAAKMADSQPGSISATERRTNVSLEGDDYVRLYLDLSGSLADFNAFTINPLGATDIRLAGGRAAKREWSGEFLAKARITESGWESEARIPWHVMRLPGAGPRTLRFNVTRQLQRTQRTYSWAYTSTVPDNFGRWTAVELPKPLVDRSIKLLPYSYIGHSDRDKFIFNSGVDLKTNLAEEVPLVISVNPDFRNIENQILSIDFSRFERLAGETRPFFQEGLQYFNSALFASQRITGFDSGLNVHGKITDQISFGVLDAVDFGNRNSFVGNVTYSPNSKDSWRVTATSLSADTAKNDAYLVRYNRLLGDYSLFFRTMGTKDGTLRGGAWNTVSATWIKGDHQLYAQYDTVTDNFVPRLGFAPERDYKGPLFYYQFNKPFAKGAIAETTFYTQVLSYDRFDGGFYRNQIQPGAQLVWRDGTALDLSADIQNFLGDKDRLYSATLRRPRGNPYNNWVAGYSFGNLAGEEYRSVRLGRAFRPFQNFQILANYQHVDHFSKSDQFILGMNFDMQNEQSISGRLVKRDKDWNGYVAFRRSGGAGTEYFLILGDPNARKFTTSLILKVVVPVQIG